MTNEEAIAILKTADFSEDYTVGEVQQALVMAIRALRDMALFRQVQATGDCNICENKNCGYKPKAGQIVRYNCPFYKAEMEKEG